MRWAMEMEPIFSMGLKSPIREDMPAATITAPICTGSPHFCELQKNNFRYFEVYAISGLL